MLVLNYFQPPPPSTRPPVIQYTISYTSYETVQMNVTSDTEFDIEITFANILILTVSALNVLGKGEGNDITSESHMVWF